ncbi:MAG: prolipoprotein diacylglyceryl transferase [Termitinemataceae bacterium]|nr:MAG: prolipoprotein diacylglyceryl transferase [Termitinemataceae bacterium]
MMIMSILSMMPLYINFPSWLHPEVIPGIPFRWYGLMYIVAFGIAYKLTQRSAKERHFPLSEDDVTSCFFWSVLGLLLGARIFSTIVYETSSVYRNHPWLVFWPFRNGHFTGLQGMSYHGGVIGCILGCTIWSIKHKVDVREMFDLITVGIPLGYTFGRLGNFINGELYGRVTTVPWGMVFPNAELLDPKQPWVAEIAEASGIAIPEAVRGMQQLINLPRHPSQLYELVLEGLVVGTILYLIRNKKPFKGFILAFYIGAYGFVRFFIEYFREPDSDLGYRLQLIPNNLPLAYMHPLTSFSTGQVFCFIMVVFSLLFMLLLSKLPGSKPVIFYNEDGSIPADFAVSEGKTLASSKNKQKKSRRKLKKI